MVPPSTRPFGSGRINACVVAAISHRGTALHGVRPGRLAQTLAITWDLNPRLNGVKYRKLQVSYVKVDMPADDELMQGVSDAFQAAVKTDHTAVCEVDIIQNGKLSRSCNRMTGPPPPIGRPRRCVRRRCLSGSTGTLTPVDMSSMLAPFGTRFRLKRRVRILSTTIIQDLDNNFTTWSGGTHMAR